MNEHPAKYHHLHPAVSMSPWVYDGDAVWGVDKKSNTGSRKNKYNFGGIEDFHTIRAGSYLATKEMVEIFFRPLQNYKVYFTEADKEDNNVVSDPFDLNEGFTTFYEWILIDESGKKVDETTKETLKEEILKHQDKTIEIEWNKQYENHWNTVLKNIENYLKSFPNTFESHKAEFLDLEQIVMFMISLKWRTKPYPMEFKKLVKKKWREDIDPTKVVFDEKDQSFSHLKTVADEFAHNQLLWLFLLFLDKQGPLYVEARSILTHFRVTLYQIPENKKNPNESPEFLTSDNPVREYEDNANKTCYYFPITPKLALEFSEYDDTFPLPKYLVRQLNKERVFEFNELMKDNSYKHYITKGDHPTRYFG